MLTLPLAAGVQVDTPSLEGLVTAGRVTRYKTQDGQVTLHLPPQSPGAVFSVTLRVANHDALLRQCRSILDDGGYRSSNREKP